VAERIHSWLHGVREEEKEEGVEVRETSLEDASPAAEAAAVAVPVAVEPPHGGDSNGS
jgi:hypothetical protein